MRTKIIKFIGFSALLGVFSASLVSAAPTKAVEMTPVADKVAAAAKFLPAGFYQFNNLEILKGPVIDEPPAVIEAIQKNDKSCAVYENGKLDRPTPCLFSNNFSNNFAIQIDERTTLLGVNQEPALLSDFEAGNKVNILGWLSADSKTIRAAVVRSLESKDFHRAFSGTIKKVESDGFTLVLENGDEVFVKTPIVEGAQITIKGVFDKANSLVNSVLSLIIKPITVLKEPATASSEENKPAPAAKPSTLFKNFLRVFGL